MQHEALCLSDRKANDMQNHVDAPSLDILFRPIGIIHSKHTCPDKTPIQPVYAKGCKGTAEIHPLYVQGLKDLEGFSHIYLIYYFHRAEPMRLILKPFLQDESRGIFATRASCRPNPIGFSIVKLIERQGNMLMLEDVDILDQTPLLDIKPYSAKFDRIDGCRSGWQDQVEDEVAKIRGKRGYDGTSDEQAFDQPEH